MSDGEAREHTPKEERARDAIRSLPSVQADAAFRDRLKADFVAGRLGGEATPEETPRRRRTWRLWVPVAAAAAVLIAVYLNGGQVPLLSDVSGDGTVTIDGREFRAGQFEEIARAVRPGARIQLPAGVSLDVVVDRTLAIQFASATATIPDSPGRWFGRTGECSVERGEVQVLTGPGFEGARLILRTTDGEIRVTGTLLSVVKDSSVTCVCVHEGTAEVGIDADDMEPIPAGQRKVMFADGRPPIMTPIAPPHDEHLLKFAEKYRDGILPVR